MAHADDVPLDSEYMDYAEHERTYRRFLALTKWVGIAVVIVVVFLATFLA